MKIEATVRPRGFLHILLVPVPGWWKATCVILLLRMCNFAGYRHVTPQTLPRNGTNLLVVCRAFKHFFVCPRTYFFVLTLLSLRRLFFALSLMSSEKNAPVMHYKRYGLIDIKNFPREGNNVAFDRKAHRMYVVDMAEKVQMQ